MDADLILLGPRLKVERADYHIDELRRSTNPLNPRWYEVVLEQFHAHPLEPNTLTYQITYRPKEPIPQLLAIIVGDIVHNLRSALDHLASGIIRTLPSPPGLRFHFPMHPQRKHLVADRSLALIEQALPGAKEAFLEKIRPADGPNEWLWRFNDLSNLDKHNLIIPTVAFSMTRGSWRIGTNTFTDCGAGDDATKPCVILRSQAPITIDQQFEATARIAFGKGDHVFEDKPVIPTLLQIRGLVAETLKTFGELTRS